MREYRRAVGAYALHDCEGEKRWMLKTDYHSSGYVTTTSLAATQRANAAPKRPEADVLVLSQSIKLERKKKKKLLPDHILESHVGHEENQFRCNGRNVHLRK